MPPCYDSLAMILVTMIAKGVVVPYGDTLFLLVVPCLISGTEADYQPWLIVLYLVAHDVKIYMSNKQKIEMGYKMVFICKVD